MQLGQPIPTSSSKLLALIEACKRGAHRLLGLKEGLATGKRPMSRCSKMLPAHPLLPPRELRIEHADAGTRLARRLNEGRRQTPRVTSVQIIGAAEASAAAGRAPARLSAHLVRSRASCSRRRRSRGSGLRRRRGKRRRGGRRHQPRACQQTPGVPRVPVMGASMAKHAAARGQARLRAHLVGSSTGAVRRRVRVRRCGGRRWGPRRRRRSGRGRGGRRRRARIELQCVVCARQV
mmetsp:Transcript_71603/g.221429  ORF Transcript_71603/g.221429 Transcript_71603/m.221429 type:complete len:235 (+) Transcript_71603:486-1190(+)